MAFVCLAEAEFQFQMRTAESSPAEASVRPSPEKPMELAPERWLSSAACCLPVGRSQTRTEWSLLLEANDLPSGEKAIHNIANAWPVNDACSLPSSRLHTLTTLSELAASKAP